MFENAKNKMEHFSFHPIYKISSKRVILIKDCCTIVESAKELPYLQLLIFEPSECS